MGARDEDQLMTLVQRGLRTGVGVFVDLGATQTPSARCVLAWESVHAKAFQIQVSSDAVNWSRSTRQRQGPWTQTLSVERHRPLPAMYGTVRGAGYASLSKFQGSHRSEPLEISLMRVARHRHGERCAVLLADA